MSVEREYEIVPKPEPDGGFSVFAPELPSVATQGETIEEATEMAKEAIEAYLEVMSEDGLHPDRPPRQRGPSTQRECQLSALLGVVPNHVVHPGLLEGWGCRDTQQQGGHRMDLHANAPFGPKGRLTMVRRVTEQGWSLAEAAEAAGVSERTVCKWVGRYRAEGEAGLWDRSSVPRSVPHRTPIDRVEAIAALRRVRMTGPEIAECLGMALSTVSAVLRRIGLGKLSRLEPLEPPNRYERARPGELIHIDVKRLVRIERGAGHRMTGRRTWQAEGAGREYVHVCIDDATRLAYVEVLVDEKARTAIGFLRRALAFYAAHGVAVERLMTDNGGAYVSTAHAIACRALGIRHIRTRPYRPRTNGKAERFIRTMLGGWAYGAIYRDSAQRTAALPGWLDFYNWRRPHGALAHRPPGTRLAELNNVAGIYS